MRHAIGSTGQEGSPISVETANGRGEFSRTAPTAANLVLEYEVSGIEAGIENSSDEALRQAVADACRQEIRQMRTALRALGDGLCEQLSEEGSDPNVDQTTNYDDSRTWTDRRTELAIDASEYHSETQLDGYEGAADARLVRKTVEVTILDREQQIRELYDNILAGVASKRAARNQQQAPAASPMEPSSVTA
jgi:hypothetical protein